MSGDDRLSPNTRHLWCIHQDILLRWGVYTIFKYAPPNIKTGVAGSLEWFVPGDVQEREKIISWLQKELVGFQQEPAATCEPDYPFPGQTVEVSISFFSGIEPYLEREHVEKMAREMMERLTRKMKEIRGLPQEDRPDSENSREDDILGPEGAAPV